jgi:hypothetical protein
MKIKAATGQSDLLFQQYNDECNIALFIVEYNILQSYLTLTHRHLGTG